MEPTPDAPAAPRQSDDDIPLPSTGGEPIHELWVPGATAAQVQRWMNEATRDFVASTPSAPADLEASVWVSPWGARVTSHRPDEGWLHAIALRAEANAVASLTIDGADFTGDTPFYAFTERRDGRHHTSWFDPLRGQSEPEPQLAALLSRYLGNAIDFEDFILGDSRQRLTQGQLLGTLVAREHGALITPGLLRPWVPWTPPPPSGLERLLILMFAAVPVGLTWFTRSFSERPTTLELAMRPAGLAALLSGVLALFPFVSPGGRVIPWPLRVIWFVGSPFAFVWLDFTLRGTP